MCVQWWLQCDWHYIDSAKRLVMSCMIVQCYFIYNSMQVHVERYQYSDVLTFSVFDSEFASFYGRDLLNFKRGGGTTLLISYPEFSVLNSVSSNPDKQRGTNERLEWDSQNFDLKVNNSLGWGDKATVITESTMKRIVVHTSEPKKFSSCAPILLSVFLRTPPSQNKYTAYFVYPI